MSASASSRFGKPVTSIFSFLLSLFSQLSGPWIELLITLSMCVKYSDLVLFGRTVMTSPALTRIDGISTRRPFSSKWPWLTSWRAARRDTANPERYTTLSRRRSNSFNRFSPAKPSWARVASFISRANCFSTKPYRRRTFCFSRSCVAYRLGLLCRPCACWPGMPDFRAKTLCAFG